jgi:hypothetical protein
MSTNTTHIVPEDGGWIIKKEGVKPDGGLYSTQKEAISAAREKTKVETKGQIVVHGRNGSFRSLETWGLPIIQRPPGKATLDAKAIKRAVSRVIRDRLTPA